MWPGLRQWVPVLVCLAFASVKLSCATYDSRKPLRAAAILTVALSVNFLFMLATIYILPSFSRGRLHVLRESMIADLTGQELSCIPVGQFLRSAFAAERPLLAVNVAGCLPFETEFPAIDMLGLNDWYIARHRPPDMGNGPLAHELGDGRYVLSRHPDLIELPERGGSPEPTYRGDFEIVKAQEFRRNYRLVYFGASPPLSLWVRIDGGNLGIVRHKDDIHIPGFLFASTPGARAIADRSGKPVAMLTSGDALIRDVDLPSGVWKVSLETDAASRMQLATLPSAKVNRVGVGTLRVVSDGEPYSFRVFGGQGLIYAVNARRVTE